MVTDIQKKDESYSDLEVFKDELSDDGIFF